MPSALNIPKEELEDLYLNKQLKMFEIADYFKCDRHTIRIYLDKYNIPIRKTNRRVNVYDLSGEYGIGYAVNTNNQFYFDLEDYEKIKDYCWNENQDGYMRANIPNTGCKQIFMHNLIMGKYEIDHIKHNTRDNRKSQLRIATKQLNARNQTKKNNNTSGCTGVSWHTRDCCWQAYIGINGKQKYLGKFDDLQEAIKARKLAEEEYYGEWSFDNSMNSNTEVENNV